jgi:hypothetical protein
MTEITRPFAPAPDKATKLAKDLPPAAKTVVLNFPRVVILQLQDFTRIRFEMGAQQVSEEIANHPVYSEWLKANGVKPYVQKQEALDPTKFPEVTDHHVRFLQSRGYKVTSIEQAKKMLDGMTVRNAAAFFQDAAAWQGQAPNPNWTDDVKNEGVDDKDNPPADPNSKPAGDPSDDKAISASANSDQGASATSQSGQSGGTGTATPASQSADAGKPKGKGK